MCVDNNIVGDCLLCVVVCMEDYIVERVTTLFKQEPHAQH